MATQIMWSAESLQIHIATDTEAVAIPGDACISAAEQSSR